jgi:hypothetical protein
MAAFCKTGRKMATIGNRMDENQKKCEKMVAARIESRKNGRHTVENHRGRRFFHRFERSMAEGAI